LNKINSIKNCDFSLEHYFEVLNSIKNEYSIGTIGEYEKLIRSNKMLMLRHDVDFSLEYALELAKKEAENQIKSTYFILFHGEYYNPFDKKSSKIIKEISDLGHEIGLHYDTSFYPKSSKKEIEIIRKEIEMLEILIQKKINCVSQHVPSETRELFINLKNEGLIDSRDPEIIKQMKYISDSGHYWREGCMCKHINKHEKLQILTHPIWWVTNLQKREEVLSTFEEDEKQKIVDNINDYKDMVDRLLINLKAPSDQFERK
jgi:hypothetical protein